MCVCVQLARLEGQKKGERQTANLAEAAPLLHGMCALEPYINR